MKEGEEEEEEEEDGFGYPKRLGFGAGRIGWLLMEVRDLGRAGLIFMAMGVGEEDMI